MTHTREAPARPAQRPRRPQRRTREQAIVPKADFRSYYGRPILKQPTWSATDVASYLFLGGTAGASSTLAAAAQLSGRPRMARVAKVSAATAIGGSLYALIHDLGRPARLLNMLRVLKPTSPMSIGSWLVAGYAPQAGLAAAADLSGRLGTIGRAAAIGAGIMGPAIATYTAPLIADTAIPAWHEAHRELPFLFVASAACSASGVALMLAPPEETGPARRLAAVAATADAAAAAASAAGSGRRTAEDRTRRGPDADRDGPYRRRSGRGSGTGAAQPDRERRRRRRPGRRLRL